MAINVRFAKTGWYHPSFGRLGIGKNLNKVYKLPDQFAEQETIKVPVLDRTSKPPRQVGEKEVTRYKYLPSSAEVIPDPELEEEIEAAKYDPELDAPVVVKPKMAADAKEKLPKPEAKKRTRRAGPATASEE